MSSQANFKRDLYSFSKDSNVPLSPLRRSASTENLLLSKDLEIAQLKDEVDRLLRQNASTANKLLGTGAEIAKLNAEVARLQCLDRAHRFGGVEDWLRDDRDKWAEKYLRVNRYAKDEKAKVHQLRETVADLKAQLEQRGTGSHAGTE